MIYIFLLVKVERFPISSATSQSSTVLLRFVLCLLKDEKDLRSHLMPFLSLKKYVVMYHLKKINGVGELVQGIKACCASMGA